MTSDEVIVKRKKPTQYELCRLLNSGCAGEVDTVIDPVIDPVLDALRLIHRSAEVAQGSTERVLYFRAIYSCGQAVMIDSASALSTVPDAAAALASPGFASMGEVLHEVDSRGSSHKLAAGPGRLGRVEVRH